MGEYESRMGLCVGRLPAGQQFGRYMFGFCRCDWDSPGLAGIWRYRDGPVFLEPALLGRDMGSVVLCTGRGPADG